MEKIKVGIIGCGKIAQVRHIPEYLASGKAEIAALYDLNKERTEELASKYGAKACSSIDELLSLPLDAVSVCTANITHAEITLKALSAGLNVLCEKPMAMNLSECEALVEAEKNSKGILMIGQNQRLAPAHILAKELMAKGEIGRVISFTTTFGHGGPDTWSIDPGKNSWFFDPKKAVFGATADLGVHKLDLICSLLDDTPAAVSAKLATLDKTYSDGSLIGVDDNAFMILEMKSGVIGTMRASWTFYGSEDNTTVIYGTEGILRIYADQDYPVVIWKKDGTRVGYESEAIQTNDNQTSSGIIDSFIRGIEAGKSEISAASNYPALKTVFAALESSQTGKRVEIN